MLKNLIAYVLLVGLLSSQIGVSAYMHYCDGELAHLALEQPNTEPCGCIEDDDGCCKDIFVKAKLNQHVIIQSAVSYFKPIDFSGKLFSEYFNIQKFVVLPIHTNFQEHQKFRWLPPGSTEIMIQTVFLRL